MTCIVAIKTADGVWMGCDSQTTFGTHVDRVGTKITKRGLFLIGTAGDYLLDSMFRYDIDLYEVKRERDVDRFVHIEVGKKIRAAFKERPLSRYSCAILATKTSLHTLTINLPDEEKSDAIFVSAYKTEREYLSIGSGSCYAYGVLYSTSTSLSPEERITKAIEAAIEFDDGCSGPIVIERL